jgi:hypothetical protein
MTHAHQEAFDVDAPFIAEDGLEYEDLAAYITQQPADCWRNRAIQEFRSAGRSEAAIREWIKGFDADDTTPTIVLYRLANEANTSDEAVRISAQISARSTPAYSRAFAVERHDDFCPF